MSYKYYEDELNRLPPDDGYGISLQVRSGGEYTKWMTLNDNCKDALRKFINTSGQSPDPDGMTDVQRSTHWEKEARRLTNLEISMRKELAKLLANPICPATWKHIIDQVRLLKEVKTFTIVHSLVADSGFVITLVQAKDAEAALCKYKEAYPHRCHLGIQIDEVTSDIREVFYHDNPNYEG